MANSQARICEGGTARGAAKYLLPALFLLSCGLSGVASAQSNHPGCYWMDYYGYQCPTPQVPATPSVSPNPSTNGSVSVTVTNGDYYSWIELNVGGTSRNCFCNNPTITRTLSPGQWSISARRCLTPDNSSIRCSSYSSPATVTVLAPLNAPSINSVSPNACGASISVGWSAGSGNPSGTTLYYEVNQSQNGGSTWTSAASGITGTSWSRSSATELTTYHFRVRAYYTFNGYTSYSSWSSASGAQLPQCAPPKPGAPSLSQPNPESNTTVNIGWSSVGSVLSYSVERSPNNSSGWTAVCTTSGTSCSDTASLTRGSTYYYRVRANKSTVSGSWSSSSSIAIAYTRPANVAAPWFSNVVPYGYTVNWGGVNTANTGPITYWLWENGTWTNVGSALSRPYSGRSPATNYEYKVQACNGGGLCSTSFPSSTINFPGVPGAIRIENISDYGRGYRVAWDASGGSVSSYELTRSTDGGSSWTTVTNQDGVLLSENISNSAAGTTYRYRVRACNSIACGNYGSVRQYWVPAAPSVSTILNASTLSLGLSWPALSASHYQLDHSINGGSWQSIATSYAQTSYSTSVINGYTYSYRVRSCNAEGACSQNAESLNNAVPPGAPASISAVQPAADLRTDVTVSWGGVTGLADGYYLERSVNGGSFTQIAQINGATTLSFNDTGLQSNSVYQYRVRAFKGSLAGAYSPASSNLRIRYLRPTVNIYVTGASEPTADVYSAGYNGVYTLNWSAGGVATSFNIRELEPAGAWQAASLTALQCAANSCNYDKPFNNSGADNIYRYRGQACNADYCSTEREVAVHVKTYPTPGPATNFSYQFTGTPSGGAYTLSWNAPSGTPPNTTGPNAEAVTHYRLSRTSPAGMSPLQFTHSNTQTAPYTRSFTGGVGGQTYTYEIVACFTPDEPGAVTVCSGASSISVRIPFAPPDQAGALTHTGLNAQSGSYTLQWTAASGQVSYYEIEQLVDENWIYFASASASSNPVAAHPNGERRSYRVRACNVDACGAYTAAYEVYMPHLQPGAPTNLVRQSQDAAGRSLTLAWSAPLSGGQVQNYEVEQSIDGGATWQAAATTANATLTVNGLNNGINYRFRARACNVDACSAYSTAATAYLPYAAPAAPGPLSHDAAEVNSASGAFTVRWTAPAAIDAALAPITYYQLEYSANNGVIWQAAPTGGATPGRINVTSPAVNAPASAVITGLATGAPYSVRARACNADACGDSTAAYQVYLPRPAPAAPVWIPTNPSTADYEARRFTVQWAPSATGTVSHYHLESYAGLNSGFESWVTVAETPALAYSFNDRSYGQVYSYRVRACSEPQSMVASCSAWVESGPVRLRYPAPKAPSGIVVSNQSGGSYTLNWNGVLGWAPEYNYELQENRNNAGWQTLTTQSSTTFNRTGRSAATYLYRVRACNPAPDSDCSAWSPQTTVTVLTTPNPPAGITIAPAECRFNVSWTPPTSGQGSYHYEFSRQIDGGSWSSIAWTTGTSHNLIVNHANNGQPHNFRVRARSLINGQYSAWSSWRTGAATTTHCGHSYNSTTDRLYVSAPRYSATGQYTVNMQYDGTAAPGFRYQYDVQTNGTWSSLGGAMPPAVSSYVYDSSNARPTARYRYRISTCDYDVYPDNTFPNNERTCPSTIDSNWDTLSIDTTVLRAPGGVGTLRPAGLTVDSVEGVYLVSNGQFTLDWSAASGVPAPASLAYEIQYRQDGGGWMPWAEQSTVDLPVTLPEFGVAYQFRVRGCARLDDYVNCGSWSQMSTPIRRSIGAPRFPAETYPHDGELVIYDRNVPLQWLPPLNMADGGIHHYEISVRSRQISDGAETWLGPEVLSTPAPVTGSNNNPPVQQASVEVEQGGQKEFLIRACGAASASSCGAALLFRITVVLPPDPPEVPAGMVGQADPDPSGGAFNGVLTGEFSVDASGAASYTLPIVVPPGTAGLEPKLSLNYSSQSGNGIAGMGWSIGGLSVISRCNKTPATDGQVRGVDYTDNDAYCLDGQRLIAVGSNQYRTEINNFRRITRITGGFCGAWFEVKTQDGLTLQYGNTADSCINAQRNTRINTAQSVVQAWALNRVTDLVGNYMNYKYLEETALGANNFAIRRIEYTGHNSSAPYSAVHFRYENERPDPIGAFNGGVGILQKRRLSHIITGVAPSDSSDDPSGYGVYTLNYEVDGDYVSRLTSVGYCATDASDGTADTQCLEPLEFEWSPWLPGWEPLAGYTPPLPFAQTDYPERKDLGARMADLNNDGLPDLLYARTGSSRVAYRNTGSGWQSWASFQPPVDFVDADGKDLGVQLADINGDDRPELLTSVINGSNRYNVYENTGNGWVLNASMALPEPVTAYQKVVRQGTRINKPSTDNGMRMADLNGDGLLDLIRGAPDGTTRQAWRNTGSSSNRWESWPQYAPPVRLAAKRSQITDWPINPPQGFEDKAYEATGWLTDFNGDNLPDLLYKITPHPQSYLHREVMDYRMRLNTGSGWGPEESAHAISILLDVESQGPDAGIRLADLNGDGLPDLMRGNHAEDLIAYNTGTGWWNVTPFEITPNFQHGYGISYTQNTQLLVDLNHDGRTDMLLGRSARLSIEDSGDGWKEAPEYGAPYSLSDNAAAMRIADLNGDGRLDLIHSMHSSNATGAWTQRSGARRITAVSDGLGNVTGVRYKALTDRSLDGRGRPIYTGPADAVNYPREKAVNSPMLVVDRVSVNDGLGGQLVTEYAYSGLTSVINGRGPQGFESMSAYKPDGTVATTRYARRFPYTGLPLEVTVSYGSGAGARLIERTVNEYCYAVTSASTTGSASDPETASFTSVNGICGAYDDVVRNNESIFVFPRRSTVTSTRLSDDLQSVAATVTTVTNNVYGAFGHLSNTQTTITGDGHSYTAETSHIYDSSQANWRWLGRVQETTSTRRMDGASDGNNTLKTRYEYYSVTSLLRKEILEPDEQAPLKVVTAYAYDQFGNTTQTTVCASDFSYCEAGAVNPNAGSPGSEQFRTTTTEYDSRGRYPVGATNPANHSESYAHAHLLGLRTSLTGANGLTTSWTYDSMGHKTSETSPFGTTSIVYRKAVGGYVPGAVYSITETKPGSAPLRTYYDGKARERRTLTQTLHGEWVAVDKEYDRFGRLVRESEPYFVYGSVAGDLHWTETYFDALGRVSEIRVPLGDIDGDGSDDGVAVSTTDYLGFETVSTDAKGRRKLKAQNALGQDVRVVNDEGNFNIEIDYTYDSQGRLATTTVDNNPATTIVMRHDRRGNKTSLTDPDMGYWEYRYNGFGQLVWQRDARQQVTEIKYDTLGRMIERRETRPGAAAQINSWVYDTAPGAGVGKLHSEGGAQGDTKIYSYTSRGQLAETRYEFNINGWSQSFVVSQTYDAFGRSQLVRYPQVGGDRLTVENRYSPFGGLWYVLDAGDSLESGDESVYWVAEITDVRGRVIQETLRNRNTINNTTNTATGWLQKVESWDKDLNMIQQTRYAFDQVGNLRSRERFRPWIVNPDGSFHAGDDEQVTEEFAYDSLDRLIGSAVSRDGILESSASHDYDRLGNFAYKDDAGNVYSYNNCGAGPHALCAAGGASFSYDANGNMIASEGAKARTIEYSVFNKPTLITENGSTVYFAYGADRARVFKQSLANGRTEVTWYVGLGAEGKPLYEQTALIEAGQIVRREHMHFIHAGNYHDGQAFAVQVQDEVEDGNPGVPNPIRYSGTEYYHRDHLGSVIAITGDTGSVEETRLLSFDAWGKRRNADWSEGGDNSVDQYTREGMRGNLAYTGHEAVPEVGLIHMNGRVYDPELGVFLSADPNVQNGEDYGSYNRYSYVQNNPLRYNDPSGYFLNSLLRKIPAGLASFISFALNFVPYCYYWCSALFSAHYAYANGADFGDALAIGAVSFFSAGIGGAMGGEVAGGLVSGAISGGFGAAMNGGDFFKGALKGAARGAAMSAVLWALNRVSAAMQPTEPGDDVVITGQTQAEIDPKAITVHAQVDMTASYKTYKEAATALKEGILKAREAAGKPGKKWEFGGFVVQVQDAETELYYLSRIETSQSATGVHWSRSSLNKLKSDFRVIAYNHYHPGHVPSVNDYFSEGDMKMRDIMMEDNPYFRTVQLIDSRDGNKVKYLKKDITFHLKGETCKKDFSNC